MSDDYGKVELQFESVTNKPTFGGSKILYHYTLTHVKYGRTNKYKVMAELRGVSDANPYFVADSAEFIGDYTETNDETLVEQAVMDLFDDVTG